MEPITVTELMRNFREHIGRVVHGGERLLLSRGGKTVAELRRVTSGRALGELPDVLESLPRLSEEEAIEFGRALDRARADLSATPHARDPWES